MADNLLAYGFANKFDAPNVAERLPQLIDKIKSYKSSDDGYGKLIRDLQKVREAVARREKLFYLRMGVVDFDGLNKKIKQIENKYNALLPDGEIIQYVRHNYSFVGIQHASNEELAAATEEVLNDFVRKEENIPLTKLSLDELNGVQSHNTAEALSIYLQENLVTESGKRFITSRKQKGTGGKVAVGLGRIISSYNPKTKKVRVDLDGKLKISSTFRTKLERDLTVIYEKYNGNPDNKIKPSSKEEYREQLNAIIEQRIGSLAFLGVNTAQFDLNRSLASTIGYLGEIRAVAMLNELIPEEANRARGTGILKTVDKGKEIPIDVVCLANGFQIKNYTLENNTFVFSGGQKVPYWVQNRLRLTGEISEVITELFGIYQYNQPLSHGDPPRLEEYENLYETIENDALYELKEVFDSRIPEIMKISEEFQANGESIFSSKQLYFNTFFWVNKYLVPSSWIIDQIITALSKKNRNSLISSEYEFVKQGKGSKYRWQVLGYEHKENGLSYNSLFMANLVKANYDISIDLSSFM